MRRAQNERQKSDVLAQEAFCLLFWIGRMPVQPGKLKVSPVVRRGSKYKQTK